MQDLHRSIRRARTTRSRLAAALVAGSIFALTACGSNAARSSTSDPSGAPSTSTHAATASGSAIAVGVIVPENTDIYNLPDVVASVKAAAYAANQAGGVKGHKVVIDFCNEEANPNQATACARQMVSDHVIATIYTLSVSGAGPQIGDILQAAGIPQIDEGAITTAEYNSLNNFDDFCGLPFEYAGLLHLFKSLGLEKVFVYDSSTDASSILDPIKAFAAEVGVKVVGSASLPTTVTDYSPYVQDYASAGADVAIPSLPTNELEALVTAAANSGHKVQFATNIEAFGPPSTVKTLGAAANGMLLDGSVPPLTATSQYPALSSYIDQIDSYHKATGDKAANLETMTSDALLAWTGTEALFKIAASLSAITAANVKHALQTDKDISVPVLGPWTPSDHEASPYQAFSDSNVYFMKVASGRITLEQTKPFSVASLVK